MARNNNKLAHERDEKVRALIRRGPTTTADLVAGKIFPKEEYAARRLRRLEQKGVVKCVGWVYIDGRMVKLWFWRELSSTAAQHEAEMTRVSRNWEVTDILRFSRIPAEWRKLGVDGVIQVSGKLLFWEHDRDTEKEDQIREKMKKLSDAPHAVLWTCPNSERMTELLALAPNERHYFALYDEAQTKAHEPIWLNNKGEQEPLPSIEKTRVQSDDQSTVQLEPTDTPHPGVSLNT